jgi:hypothetical protein
VLLAAPAGLSAQSRVSLSPGVALGTAVGAGTDRAPLGRSGVVHGRHALLTLDVEARGVPVRLRGEAMAVALTQAHGPLSLGASLVLPLGAGRLRPYALAGAGVYGVGSVGHPVGWSAGAGAELRQRGATFFLEARRHSQTASGVSVGVRF